MGKKSWVWWGLGLYCYGGVAPASLQWLKSTRTQNNLLGLELKDILGRMTLQEKIGQMVQIDRTAATVQIMKDYYIEVGGSIPLPKATAADWVNMENDYQNGSLSTRLGIPMIYGIDAVHGHNNVFNATIFPHNIGLGAARDPELMRRIGDATALEVRATGIPYVFAPCIAVGKRWLLVQSTLFDGGTTKGINENNTVTSMNELLSIHMPAYYDSIVKGVSTVMASYSSWNGRKIHADRDLITDFLKGFCHFRLASIDRLTSPPHANYTYSVETSILAGVDMIMVPYNFTEFINDLTYLVKNNFIPMDRIDDAVERILSVKFTMGLFENPYTDFSLINEVGSQEHRNLAREAVRKSIVLLKNGKTANNPLLPLPKKVSEILVAGSHADNLGYQCGGWTITWLGFSGNEATRGTTILGAIKSAVDPETEVIYVENPDSKYATSGGFDYAIVAVGEHTYAESAGDSPTLIMVDPGPDVVNNVCQSVKCVVIFISGRPVVIEPYLPSIDALVAAWLPGTEGQGITDLLFGDYGFTGKLPRTWFRTVDQLPRNVGDPHYDPLFPFGFGLTTSKSTIARSVSTGSAGRPNVLGIMVFVVIGFIFKAFY
ncbi:unnamed protein product [Withania somnifera]